MVQVLNRSPDGSIVYIQLHDVLSELAVRKAEEFNFFMVCSKSNDWEYCSKAPRMAIHYPLDLDISLGNYASHNVYSLFIFNVPEKEIALNLDCSKLRKLKVLGCDEWWEKVKLQSLEEAPHMRYLQLGADIKGKESEFEEWIRGMKYLQTLDMEDATGYLSDCMWQAKTQLRHVLAHHYPFERSIIIGPPASIDLKNLQTLKGVEWNDQWGTSSFPNIPNVRHLSIYIPGNVSAREVASLIGRLKHVVHLTILGDAIDLQEIATATGSCLFNENLKFLNVNNYNDNRKDSATLSMPLVLRDDMLPPHLVQLLIGSYEFGSDFMPVLEKLGSLKYLYLRGTGSEENENRVRRIKCSAGGFKQLETLTFWDLPLEEWEIELRAMPMLKQLQVYYCDPLRVPPQLTDLLSGLQSLQWETHIQANKDAIKNIFEQRPNLRPSWSSA